MPALELVFKNYLNTMEKLLNQSSPDSIARCFIKLEGDTFGRTVLGSYMVRQPEIRRASIDERIERYSTPEGREELNNQPQSL